MSYSRFVLLSAGLALLLQSHSQAATMTATTAYPEAHTFVPGQAIGLQFQIAGLDSNAADTLAVKLQGEHGQTVWSKSIPLAPGSNEYGLVRFENNTWLVDVLPPTNRLGFFQVFGTLSDGTELIDNGRLGKSITYAIVPDPFERVHYAKTNTFFGIMCARGDSEVLMGCGVDLFNYQSLHWAHFEPEHAGQFKDLINEKKDHPWEIIPGMDQMHGHTINGKFINWPVFYTAYIFNAPPWAEVPGTRGHMTATIKPEAESAWHDFCYDLAKLYSTTYSNESIQHFEITTEPMFGWGYKGTAEGLVRAHEIAYKAIHEANPKATVGGPTFTGVGAGGDWGFVDTHKKIFEAGIGQYIDVMHMHPYVGQPEECQFVEKIRAIKKIMRDTVGHEIPMAGTEGGYSYFGDTKENWEKKAWSDVRANLIMLGEGFIYNIAFYGDSSYDPNGEAWGFYVDGKDGMANLSPIPVVPAYSAMSFLLEGHKSAGSIEWLGDTAWGYAYQGTESNDHDIVLAVWDWSGTARPVSIPVGTDQVTVYDWMGNANTVHTPKGILNLSLTKDPQYVKGASYAMWSRDTQKPLTLSEKQIEVYPGKDITLTVAVKDVDGKGIKGELALKDNAALAIKEQIQPIELAASGETQIVFHVTVPVTTAAGSYPAAMMLEQDSVPRAAVGCMVRVLAPATMTRVVPAVASNGPAIRVQLKAATDVEGTVEAAAPSLSGPMEPQPVKLAAGEQKDYLFQLAGTTVDPTKRYDVTATMTTREGSRQTVNKNISFLAATRLTTPITLDGKLDEWTNIVPVKLTAPDALRVPAGLVTGTNDLATDIRFAWDDKALYLSFDVMDNAYQQDQIEWATWMGDCVQIGLNLDPESVHAGAMSTIEAGGMRRWQEIDIADTRNGPDVYRTMTYDNRFCPGGPVGKDQATLAVKREKGRITYELALPWKTLSADKAPLPGDCLGFACTVNDRDPNRADLLVMGLFNGVYGGKDLEAFGWVVLGE